MLSIVLAWETFKDWLSATVHLTHWDLHVILGLAFFFAFGRLLRRPLTAFLPLLPVALLELGNETLDFLRAYIPHWDWNLHDTVIEVALTLGPPLCVILLARSWPALASLARRGWFRLRFPTRRAFIHIRTRTIKRLK
ncbi:hypothetical protein [Sphingomonas sp. CROZ-RG-20F-R02-07]|uniref:hypothetical protein n=1 Tax=Sphingomonas sp. CROZ-RG-20F-R02-07 TaxID=2914832 RepID=UPI001F578A95|nr:hypothetical protein [Sphingomonas sp. CROZ-RG-20F-R02-07]